jgi:hypothetical protein
LDAPCSPAFDAGGDLWVASPNTGDMLLYNVDADDDPLPARDMALARRRHYANRPHGLAFDNAGSLWDVDGENGGLLQYAADDLSDGEALADAAIIIAGVGEATRVRFSFNPSPTD